MKTLEPCGDAPHDYCYVLLSRPKSGKPYAEQARFKSSGQSCLATAEEHCEKQLGWPEDTIWHSHNLRLVLSDAWAAMQARYHLARLYKQGNKKP